MTDQVLLRVHTCCAPGVANLPGRAFPESQTRLGDGMGRPFHTSIVSPHTLHTCVLRSKQFGYNRDQSTADARSNTNHNLAKPCGIVNEDRLHGLCYIQRQPQVGPVKEQTLPAPRETQSRGIPPHGRKCQLLDDKHGLVSHEVP